MFPGKTEILMSDGSRQTIARIKAGDEVFSHTGHARKVLGKKKRQYSGKLLRFDAGGRNWISCCEDAPFFFTRTGKKIYGATVVTTGVKEKILVISFPALERLLKRKDDEPIYWEAEMAKVRECEFLAPKTQPVYSLDVEEEHSYVLVGYSGSIVIPTRC